MLPNFIDFFSTKTYFVGKEWHISTLPSGCLPDYKTIFASGLKGREFYADYDEIICLADFCQTL